MSAPVDAPDAPVVGAVLCGGASRRMGRDKALIERGGVPLARRVADALASAGCTTVLAIGGDGPALASLGLVTVVDRYPGEGPLGGLATALAAAPPGSTLLLAPCDVLDPDPGAMAAVVHALGSAPDEVDGAVPVGDGRAEWTHAAWRVRPVLVEAVTEVLEAGERRLDAVDRVTRTMRIEGIAASAFADADTPDDLDRPSPSP